MDVKLDAPPSSDEILKLPCWARVAFAARCAERALPAYTSFRRGIYLHEVERAVLASATAAANTGIPPERVVSARADIEKAFRHAKGTGNLDEILDGVDQSDPVYRAYNAIEAVRSALDTAESPHDSVAASAAAAKVASQVIADATRYHPTGEYKTPHDLLTAIWNDYQNLIDAARRDDWTDSTPVSQSFFGLYSIFDIESAINNQSSIIDLVQTLDRKLLTYFMSRPTRLYQLNPRQFEELVAELIHQLGFEPVLTQRTRDGGADVIALDKSDGSMKYLIECKRYRPENRVGVAIVRQLGGVVLRMKDPTKPFGGWPRGIVVTTSSFTVDARRELSETSWALEGRDFDGIVEWLRTVQMLQITNALRLPT